MNNTNDLNNAIDALLIYHQTERAIDMLENIGFNISDGDDKIGSNLYGITTNAMKIIERYTGHLDDTSFNKIHLFVKDLNPDDNRLYIQYFLNYIKTDPNLHEFDFEKINNYTIKTHVYKSTATRINTMLNTEPKNESECMSEDETFTHTIVFPDGYSMDIKICGVQFDEDAPTNKPWTEAVLFNKNGYQINQTDVEEDFFGTWEIENPSTKKTYTVIIES